MIYRRLLVGLDWDLEARDISAGARAAIEHAMWVAQLGDDVRVDLVHSASNDRFEEHGEHGYLVRHSGLPDEGRARMEAEVERFADAGIPAQLTILDGRPELGIVREVLRHGADLVVLGKHDERGPRSHLGSVASKVLRKCPATVCLLDPARALPPRRVLAATDLTEVGQRVLANAAWLTGHSHGELHIVHVFAVSLEDQFAGDVTPERLDEMRVAATAETKAQWSEVGSALEPHFHVGCSSPVRAICDGVEQIDADLLVLATAARGGIAGFLMGNTAEKVLPRVGCSLLVVKPTGFVCPVELEPTDAAAETTPQSSTT